MVRGWETAPSSVKVTIVGVEETKTTTDARAQDMAGWVTGQEMLG